MKRFSILTIYILMYSISGQAQFTLDRCQELARENYPLIKQHGLIEQSTEYSIANALKAYLPQVAFSAQATYQSDVAAFPKKMTDMYEQIGINMKGLNRDQYRVALDVNQTIWDGGFARAQKESSKAEGNVSAQSVETELYSLRERINMLYFGILIINEQLRQNNLLQNLLQSNYNTIDAYVKNGVAMPGDLQAIKAEQLTVSQQRIQIESAAKAYRTLLSVMIGQAIDETATLEKPPAFFSGGSLENRSVKNPTATVFSSHLVGQSNNRPELLLFDMQSEQLEVRKRSVVASTMPRLGVFIQGFYGNPGLNLFKDMTEDKWTWNYIAGLRLQWNFGSFYTKKGDIAKLSLAQQQIDNKRETFLFNTGLQEIQQQQAIEKMRRMMIDDDEIIFLRLSIRQSSEAKFANGTITISELLKDITTESQALLSKTLHELEWLQNIYELREIINND